MGRGREDGNLAVYPRFIRAGMAYLSPPAACPPAALKAKEQTRGTGEPADIPAQRAAAASLVGAAFWVNIVPHFFFFLFK